jgi:hypothetical protein
MKYNAKINSESHLFLQKFDSCFRHYGHKMHILGIYLSHFGALCFELRPHTPGFPQQQNQPPPVIM